MRLLCVEMERAMAKKTEKELEIQRLDKKTPLQMFRDYVMITVASFVYAVSVSMFLDPNSLAPGGITGIAIILNRLFGIETGTWMLLINIPILLIGIWKFGLRFILSTIYCTAMTSLFTNLLTPVGAVTTDPLLASLTGSALMAVSMGWVFKAGSTTGGTDIIAAIVNKYKDVSLGRMIMICDVFIISSCYFIFHDWRRVIFGFVTLFIIGVVLDWIINSARQSVQFFIFSKKYDEIADRIIKDADRGVTVLDGTGWYSKNNVKVLVVLAKKRQSLEIFRLVKRIDPNAFISQSSVIGVYGEGFDKLKVK